MFKDVAPAYRDALRRHCKWIEYHDHFCCTVTTPLPLSEALRCIGLDENALQPADAHDIWDETEYLLIGQVGQSVVTFGPGGRGRFFDPEGRMEKDRTHGVIQWDFYNLTFWCTRPDGNRAGWDDETVSDGIEETPEGALSKWRDGAFAKYADLFEHYLQLGNEDEDEQDQVLLRAVMLTIVEAETGIRLDDNLIRSLPHTVHVPDRLIFPWAR